MCNSVNSGCSCSPSTVFTEKICGNYYNGTADTVTRTYWQIADPTDFDYIQGTFQLFSSTSNNVNVTAQIFDTTGVINLIANPGTTDTGSINLPSTFLISIPAGHSGKYCITLYKRVLA